MSKIYFRTNAYNAEKTVARCIESVLNQTKYGDSIVFYICDNGSKDKTGEIIRSYAAKDPRIRFFSNKINMVWEQHEKEYFELSRNLRDDDLYCRLDADDSYAPDFLEKMIPFMKEHNLDMAACGNLFIDAGTCAVTGKRVLPEALILDGARAFTDYFPVYHQFMRTAWGKVYSGKAARNIPTNDTAAPEMEKLVYGMDTVMAFSALSRSERVGIYPEALYNYYVSKKSSSYRYNENRVFSDQYLYKDAESFLLRYGEISRDNRAFLNLVYANAVTDTLNVLKNAKGITPAEKLSELEKISEYPRTSEAFSLNHPDSLQSKRGFISALLSFSAEAGEESRKKLTEAAKKHMPRCAAAVSPETSELFCSEGELTDALARDDRIALAELLLKYIKENRYVKRYDLYSTVFALSMDKPLLRRIRSKGFLKKYGFVYLSVFKEQYGEALEQMTDLLLKTEVKEEDLLLLYCNLSALTEQTEEFIFGKIKLAVFYFREKRVGECKEILADLEEMGVENTDEIAEIKRLLY